MLLSMIILVRMTQLKVNVLITEFSRKLESFILPMIDPVKAIIINKPKIISKSLRIFSPFRLKVNSFLVLETEYNNTKTPVLWNKLMIRLGRELSGRKSWMKLTMKRTNNKMTGILIFFVIRFGRSTDVEIIIRNIKKFPSIKGRLE